MTLTSDSSEIDRHESFFRTDNKLQRYIPFYMSEDFIKSYAAKIPPWGPIGEFTFLRTYSRWIESENGLKRKERWHETVKRVVEGCFNIQKKHCYVNKVPWNNTKSQNSAKIMFDLMFNMKFLPPGRGLWMMGTKYVEERGSACLNNCAFVSTKNLAQDSLTPFEFLMDMSMLGVGVGFNTKGQDTIKIKEPIFVDEIAFVPDTREGWVEVMSIVLGGFFNGTKIPNFDYSNVRPKGSPIRGFGGEASGPGPLMDLVSGITNIYGGKVGRPISSSDIVDTACMIGKCVVSGNVRRSALIALGQDSDEYFLDLKNYEVHPEENGMDGWRWASNNSIYARVGQDYTNVANRTAVNGEPGYVWMDNIRKYGRMVDPINNADYKAEGVNPCSEQSLENMELCCLVETFPSKHKTYDDYKLTLKYAYLYAKTVTLIPTHWHQTNAVMLRNRRIGTSQSGIIDSFAKHGRAETLKWCDNGYLYLRDLDSIYSDWLCIPRSIKITSVKPSGSVSLLPGVSPGIHYPHAQYYIRRIRVASDSPLVDIMKSAGYKVEVDVKLRDTTSVVEFPVKTDCFVKGKKEVTMWEQFLNAADYQKWWCDNQVSITITFKEEEARDINTALSIFDTALKSVSLLPSHDFSYPQMPYEEINEEQYNEMVAKLTKPDFSGFMDDAAGEKYCDGDTCVI